MTLARRGVPFHINPALAPAADALGVTLFGLGYHEHARGKIVALALVTGDPTASEELCDEDQSEAVDAWVDALPEVPYSDPAWDRDDAFLDVAMLAAGTHPLPWGIVPPELEDELEPPDAPDDRPSRSSHFADMLAWGIVAPISGGAPTRLDGDVRDFEEWLDQVDQPYPPADQPADRHSPESLARLNLALYGQVEPFHA
jgi:hypothetical protein